MLAGDDEEATDWIPPTGEELEEAWQIWLLLESTDWQHVSLQWLLEQSDRLMSNIGTISYASRFARRQVRKEMGLNPK